MEQLDTDMTAHTHMLITGTEPSCISVIYSGHVMQHKGAMGALDRIVIADAEPVGTEINKSPDELTGAGHVCWNKTFANVLLLSYL